MCDHRNYGGSPQPVVVRMSDASNPTLERHLLAVIREWATRHDVDFSGMLDADLLDLLGSYLLHDIG